MCNANEYVSDHVCTPCPAGEEHSAGQDASGPDSSYVTSQTEDLTETGDLTETDEADVASGSPPSPSPSKDSGNPMTQPMAGAVVVVTAMTVTLDGNRWVVTRATQCQTNYAN